MPGNQNPSYCMELEHKDSSRPRGVSDSLHLTYRPIGLGDVVGTILLGVICDVIEEVVGMTFV